MKFLSILALAALVASPAAALAQGNSVNVRADATTTVSVQGSATSSAVRSNNQKATTSTSTPANNSNRANATTTANVHGQLTAETHRSEVAAHVESLLSLADRSGGIGSEVRVVAQSQMNAASTSARAMEKIEKRSKLVTFFVGTDYRSVGEIRSQLAVTENNIAKLRTLRDSTTDASVRAELDAEIDALVDMQAELEAFVDTNESTFSLFGWFVRLFVRS